MRSTPSEEVFMPESINIIDIEGNPVCRLKRQIPARKEIPILKLLIRALEETQFKEFLEQVAIIQGRNESGDAFNAEDAGILLTHLPKILNVLPDHIVECFSILVDLEKEQALERFNLAYMIEVLVPFLLNAFKPWMEQFQVMGQKLPAQMT